MTAHELEIIHAILHDMFEMTRHNAVNCRDRDSYRSYHSAEAFTTLARTLRHFGLKIEEGTYDDVEVERIGYCAVEGYTIVSNGEWQFDTVKDLCFSLASKVA